MMNWLKQVLLTFVGFALVYFLIGWLVLKQNPQTMDYHDIVFRSALFGLLFGTVRHFRRNKEKQE